MTNMTTFLRAPSWYGSYHAHVRIDDMIVLGSFRGLFFGERVVVVIASTTMEGGQ